MQMEQIPLNLNIPEDPESKEVALETLEDDELMTLYHEAVGKDPKPRLLGREKLIAGIQDPEAEVERLRILDAEDKHVGNYR
jgi:hypothetical protein